MKTGSEHISICSVTPCGGLSITDFLVMRTSSGLGPKGQDRGSTRQTPSMSRRKVERSETKD